MLQSRWQILSAAKPLATSCQYVLTICQCEWADNESCKAVTRTDDDQAVQCVSFFYVSYVKAQMMTMYQAPFGTLLGLF